MGLFGLRGKPAMANEVRCDRCGCAFVPEMMCEQDGDLAYQFFRCGFCGKAFVVTATDTPLRMSIAKYAEMAEQNKKGRLSEAEQCKLRNLKEENKARADRLRELLIRGDENGGE